MGTKAGIALVASGVGLAWGVPHLLTGHVDGWLLTYGIRPGCWILCGIVALAARAWTEDARIPADRSVITLGALVGLAHVLALVVMGLLTSFGHSPYATTGQMIALNALLAGSMLFGTETARAYVVAVVGKRSFTVGIIASAALVAFVTLTPAALASAATGPGAMSLLGGRVLPSFSESLAASLLSFLGGVWASVAYVGILELFRWFSPILPDAPWMIAGIAGTLVPMVLMLVIAGVCRDRLPDAAEETPKERRSYLGWIGIAAFAALLIWFSTGALGPTPLLVASRSMTPEINLGDVVVVSPVDAEQVALGDVIAFLTPDGTTIHRVVSVEGEGDQRRFITKGDANDSPDAEPVYPANLRGRVVLVAPKVGWVGIAFRNAVGALTGQN